ncbi:Ribokinase-like protein [Testicularia cyperi]|uniref:Ribokinase n=1 Tax=Testicularia cyperi TaxID=1882483 RepID=A0A317XIK8_9BASI|nr:Ribokinase-like protein [Testicularia cyperi]
MSSTSTVQSSATSSEKAASKPFCLVKSSINIDETFAVPHIVKPGETISSTGLTSRPGGKGANVSAAIALAGATVTLSGAVGKDAPWPVDELKSRGVDTSSIETLEDTPTGRAFIQIAEDGENSIVLLKGANFATGSKSSDPAHAFKNAAQQPTHLVLQNEIPLETTVDFLKYAKTESPVHVTTVFNPSPMLTSNQVSDFPWSHIDVLIVNEGEGLELLSVLSPHDHEKLASLPTGAEKSTNVLHTLSTLPQLSSTPWIVLTRGGAGVMAHVQLASQQQRSFFDIAPFKPRQVKDTTGAGDTFAGNLVAALMGVNVDPDSALLSSAKPSSQHFVTSALEWASKAASLACEKEGAMQSIPKAQDVKARTA